MLWTVDAGARTSLQEQIAGCVRRAAATGELAAGERLPPAQELAEALSVDRNTVLAAYRRLREDGLLEFRRGRGVRVTDTAAAAGSQVDLAARELVTLARHHGYSRDQLVALIDQLT